MPLSEPHLAAMAVGALAHRRRPWRLPGRRGTRALLALPLVLIGVGVIVSAVAQIGSDDVERDDLLVTDGPYAWTRNPMYVGWALVHVGTGVASGSGWILATYPAAAVAIHREILREERRLGRRLGRAFGVYADAVPRYLPVR